MTDFAQIRARTLIPNGDKVADLRKKKGLTVEELAVMSDVDPSTIKKMEKGEPKFKKQIERVAKSLGVLPIDLVAGNPAEGCEIVEKAPQRAATKREGTITLILNLPRSVLDNKDSITIVYQIGSEAQTQGPIVINDERIRSVHIEIELNKKDAELVMSAFMSGKLAEHSIKSITVESPERGNATDNKSVLLPNPEKLETYFAYGRSGFSISWSGSVEHNARDGTSWIIYIAPTQYNAHETGHNFTSVVDTSSFN